MNLIVHVLPLSILLQLCFAQDYTYPNYNQQSPANPTNDYSNTNDPRYYDNPYDPNKRFSNRNQYDANQNKYDLDQKYSYDNRNEPSYNQNPYSPENTPRPSWDSGRQYSNSYKSVELEHDSVIINEA